MAINNVLKFILGKVAFASSFLPLIIGVITFRSMNGFLKPLLFLVLLSIAVDVNSAYYNFIENNSYVIRLFTLIEFILTSLFYSSFLKKYMNPWPVKLMIPLFMLVCFIDLKINGVQSNDNLAMAVECIMLSLYSMFLFYFILKNLLFDNLLKSPVFWVNSAILMYFSGNLFLFVFSNYFSKRDPAMYTFAWSGIHSFFYVFYNSLLSIGFWKTRTR